MENTSSSKLKVINRDILKYYAALVMFMGHALILWAKIPGISITLLRFINFATLSAPPIFFFFVAEGYRYTHNKKKYLLRVLICAIITQLVFIPFSDVLLFNIIFSIFFALLSLVIWDRKWPLPARVALIAGCIAITYFAEWELVVPLFVMIFYFLDKRPVLRFILYEIVMTLYLLYTYTGGQFGYYMLATSLPIIIITFFYNGKKGSNSKFNKYFFYVFYPAHWLIINVLTVLIG